MNDVLTWILAVAVVILAAAVVYLLFSKKNGSSGGISEKALTDALYKNNQALRQEMQKSTQQSISSMGNMLSVNQQNFSASQTEKLMQLEQRLGTFSSDNQQKLEQIRQTVEKRLEFIRDENSRKLEQMRATVDEKLQKTLAEKMTRSFSLVTERLEQVYKGLREMQTLAAGVGDLKKVLSNVKTRGILGELQLSAILKEILSPEQYCENVVTVPKSKNPVEFCRRPRGRTQPPVRTRNRGLFCMLSRNSPERSPVRRPPAGPPPPPCGRSIPGCSGAAPRSAPGHRCRRRRAGGTAGCPAA